MLLSPCTSHVGTTKHTPRRLDSFLASRSFRALDSCSSCQCRIVYVAVPILPVVSFCFLRAASLPTGTPRGEDPGPLWPDSVVLVPALALLVNSSRRYAARPGDLRPLRLRDQYVQAPSRRGHLLKTGAIPEFKFEGPLSARPPSWRSAACRRELR